MMCCGEDKTGTMGMMSKMMEGDHSDMMMEMMPKCLGMMLQKMPEEERAEFALKMVATLVEQASAGMSDEEKESFLAKVLESVRAKDRD